MATHDYRWVTLDRVATHVGVAKSSILWHFGTKEALLTEAVFDLFNEIDAAVEPDLARITTLEERKRILLETIGRFFEENPETKGVVISLMFDSTAPKEIRMAIREQWLGHTKTIAKLLSGDDATVSLDAAATIMAIVHGCYLQWHLNGQPPGFGGLLTRACAGIPAAHRLP